LVAAYNRGRKNACTPAGDLVASFLKVEEMTPTKSIYLELATGREQSIVTNLQRVSAAYKKKRIKYKNYLKWL